MVFRPLAANDSIPLQVELIPAEDLHAFPHLLLDQLEMVRFLGADEWNKFLFLSVSQNSAFFPQTTNHRPLRTDGLSSQVAVLILFSSRSESYSGFFISSGRAAARLGAPRQAAAALAERHEAHRAIQRAVLAVFRMALHALY